MISLLTFFCKDNPTNLFGKKLHEQVDDRLKFYETGEAPIKNEDAMQEVLQELKEISADTKSSAKKKKKKKKNIENKENGDEEANENGDEVAEVTNPLSSNTHFVCAVEQIIHGNVLKYEEAP